MERRLTLVQKLLTIPMAVVAVAELFYLRWSVADGWRCDGRCAVEKAQAFTPQTLPTAAAA